MITKTDRELFESAMEAGKNAYAPYSNLCVGAALLSGSGKVYTGVNVENASFGATVCAERTAFLKAISEGEKDFEAIAVAAGRINDVNFSPLEVVPCSICRQFMFEFNPDIKIIIGTDSDSLETYVLRELMPKGFDLKG